ncbi:MAG: DNA polymerase III delta subunit HolA [Rhodobacteraceae bacterium HLUCCA12]|nr:MAG: DNA polymerase III delta subunit HolA [Rhodobacteraceae bacterium HLUCCA12]
MKLSPRDAPGFLARPDPRMPGILIHGSDVMRVAERRQTLIRNLIGPQGETEMRLARFAAADLRKDPAAALDAIKAQGFFPGTRAVLIEEATDSATESVKNALTRWADGDAVLVVTAGQLNASSKLRKAFESDKRALAMAVYDDPPGRDEIEAMLRDAGLSSVPPDAMRDLTALAQILEPGDFRQTLTKIALYKHGDDTPLSSTEIAALAPQDAEAGIDAMLDAVAEGRPNAVPPLMARLIAQGVAPVTLCIGAMRHFRLLHTLVSDPRGPSQAIGALRPPVFGPRRDRILRHAQRWRQDRIEQAMSDITETDLTLRSTSRAPLVALTERTFLRLATMAARLR